MDPERSAEWAARVAAWHDRDPLSLRVAAEDVGEFGWVDLPFAGGGARDGWRAVFSEAVLPGVRASRVARWALRHGQDSRPDGAGPLHQVAVDRRLLPAQGQAAMLWVGRATVATPRGRTTVLLDPRPGGAVLGRRVPGRRRIALAAAALAGVVGLTSGFAWVVATGSERAPTAAVAASAATASAASGIVGDASAAAPSTASTANAASSNGTTNAANTANTAGAASGGAAASAGPAARVSPAAPALAASRPTTGSAAAASTAQPAPGAAAGAPSRAAFAAVAAATAGAPASAPTGAPPAQAAARPDSGQGAGDGAPLAPRVEPVVTTGRIVEDRPLLLDEADRVAARAAGEAARAAAAARRIERLPVAWALAGPPQRTPAEAQLAGRDLARALKAAGAEPCPRIDPMPAGDDWRSVCWPFVRRADGERLRAALGERGARFDLVEF